MSCGQSWSLLVDPRESFPSWRAPFSSGSYAAEPWLQQLSFGDDRGRLCEVEIRAYAAFDHIVVASALTAEMLQSSYNVDASRLQVMSPPITALPESPILPPRTSSDVSEGLSATNSAAVGSARAVMSARRGLSALSAM